MSNFQNIAAFGHSAFITSQSIFVLTNMVMKRYLACRTFSKCQPYSNESCLFIHTYTLKSQLTIGCTTASLERCLSTMAVLQIHLRNHCGEEQSNCNYS